MPIYSDWIHGSFSDRTTIVTSDSLAEYGRQDAELTMAYWQRFAREFKYPGWSPGVEIIEDERCEVGYFYPWMESPFDTGARFPILSMMPYDTPWAEIHVHPDTAEQVREIFA